MEQLLLYSIAFLLVVWAMVLLVKKNRHPSDILLAIWLLLLSTVYSSNDKVWEFCLTFTHCVFVFLYVRCIVKEEKFKSNWLIHFIPFVIWISISIFYPQFIREHLLKFYGVMLLYLSIYSWASIQLVYNYRKNRNENLRMPLSLHTSWLYIIIAVVILGHLIKIGPYYLAYQIDDQEMIKYIYIAAYSSILIAILACGLKSLRLELTVFKEVPPQKNRSYSTYNLDDSDVVALGEKLLDLMETQKPYLITDLSLKDLSDRLGIAPHNLSFLLNKKFGQNFYEFINHYRLEAAKKDLVDLSKKHLSIFAIAYDCGFNSLSTFNRVFKQNTLVSPSQYKNDNSNCTSSN